MLLTCAAKTVVQLDLYKPTSFTDDYLNTRTAPTRRQMQPHDITLKETSRFRMSALIRQRQPPDIVAIAQKAQLRLVNKLLRLDNRRRRHVAITAVARELCGFVWAILMALPEH
jgi:hypothetical protein